MAASDDSYVCTLNDFSLKVAKEELNEDPKERLSHVETFRKWILDQKHLKCPTDTVTLLKFLRTAKFSQLRARSVLEGNMKNKTKYPEWMVNIDMADPKIVDFMKTGYMLVLPKRLPNQRLLLINNSGACDIASGKWEKLTILRAMFGLGYYYMMDENDMVNGFEFFQDFSHFAMKQMTFWGIDTMKKTTKMFQGHTPGRFKGFHYFNVGPVFETITTITKPLLSKKYQDRMKIHGKNMEDVYKYIPMECFPLEYLPDDYTGPSQGRTQDIIDNLVKDLTSPRVRDYILYQTRKEWGYDFSLKPEEAAPAESFRKLNVD